jgi:hypothetical protein
MSQREEYREALAAYFGNKILRATGQDYADYRRRSGKDACARFFAEADQIIAILEQLGLTFEDEDLFDEPEPIKPTSKKK